MEKEKKLLFSLTAKDFEFQYFCTGGPGGQHKNAKRNGVRCIHKASGAVAQHRDGRDQFINKRLAFEKCANTNTFKRWHKVEVARRLGQTVVDEEYVNRQVDAAMQDKNLRIEYV